MPFANPHLKSALQSGLNFIIAYHTNFLADDLREKGLQKKDCITNPYYHITNKTVKQSVYIRSTFIGMDIPLVIITIVRLEGSNNKLEICDID